MASYLFSCKTANPSSVETLTDKIINLDHIESIVPSDIKFLDDKGIEHMVHGSILFSAVSGLDGRFHDFFVAEPSFEDIKKMANSLLEKSLIQGIGYQS
jgi:hypothetical protein